MANYRQGRVNEEMRKELSEILRTVKDPRVTTAFVSITGVDCSADLKFAKVFFSVMGERRSGDAGKGLENASGYIRTQLARNLNLRITPELKFICDDSMKRGAHITELLKKVEKELDEIDSQTENSENDNEALEENADAEK